MKTPQSKLAVFYDETFLEYEVPPGMFDSRPSPFLGKQIAQPEGPDRILNTKAVLENSELSAYLEWLKPVPATDEEILMFHTQAYLDRLIAGERKAHYFSDSTYMVEGGMRFIRLSAGCAINAAQHVVTGKSKLAYAISRPPSHHAQPNEADGYCFVNGIGLAVLEAIKTGYQRIAVVDWDVHHGNGTQQGFYERDDVLTISMHMDHGSWGNTHLQTGDVDEIGSGPGEGYNINLPLPFGVGDKCYNQVFERCVVPAVTQFNPDLIILANGQDANQFDPNGRQCLTMAGYHAMATQLSALSAKCCDGKLVMTQEGGYNPTYAPYCAYAVAAGLLGLEMEINEPIALYPDEQARADADTQALITRHPLLNN